MSKILVLPFKLAELETGVKVLISRTGCVRLSSEEVWQSAKALAAIGWGRTLSASELEAILYPIPRASRADAARFFADIAILRDVDERFGRFAGIRLVHAPESVQHSLCEDLSYLTGLPCALTTDPAAVGENELVIVFSVNYDEVVIHAAQRAVCARANSPLLVAYLRCRSLMIDGLYIPGAHTPCHFCQRAPEGSRSVSQRAPLQSWAGAVQAMSVKPPVVGMEYHVTDLDLSFCAAVLRNRVREIVGPAHEPLHARNVLDRWELDLDGFQVRRAFSEVNVDCEFCAA